MKIKFIAHINEFVIYSFAGWFYETMVNSVLMGRLYLDRGFLHIPICPIYGFGALIMLFLFHRINKELNIPTVFIGGTVVTTIVEYISALLIENTLHTTLWDYSEWICNFQGRISLISSLIFGCGCVWAYKFVNPLMLKLSGDEKHKKITTVTAVVCAVVVAIDFVICVVERWNA